MEKIKQYKFIILIVVIILGFTFYWFEWRPSKIKEWCYAEAEFDQRATFEANDEKRNEFINSYYENCVRRFGL